MNREKILLRSQAVLCVVFVVILAYGAVHIYLDGSARKAADPSENIYTVEGIADAVLPALPVLCAGIALTVTGAVLGVRNTDIDQPVQDGRFDKRVRGGKASGENAKEWNRNPLSADRQRILRLAVFISGVIFTVVGIANGSMRDVFVKAINVCTECIGLG